MELGVASLVGTMEGSFLAPDMHLTWEAPEAAASGSVDLSRDSNSITCRAPAVDVSAALLLKPAPIDAVKTVLTQVNRVLGRPLTRLSHLLDATGAAASAHCSGRPLLHVVVRHGDVNSAPLRESIDARLVARKITLRMQAEATALAQPQIEGADIDCNFKGLDVLPLAAALERGAAAKTQRLKLNGRTKLSVRLTPQEGPVEGETSCCLNQLTLVQPVLADTEPAYTRMIKPHIRTMWHTAVML